MAVHFKFAYYITVNKVHLKTVADVYSQLILSAKRKLHCFKNVHAQMLPFTENECTPVVKHWLGPP